MNATSSAAVPASIFSTVRKWGEFVRFSHTIFALPFALAAMVVAARANRGWPGWRVLGGSVHKAASLRSRLTTVKPAFWAGRRKFRLA